MKLVTFDSIAGVKYQENVYFIPRRRSFLMIDSFFIVPSWKTLFDGNPRRQDQEQKPTNYF